MTHHLKQYWPVIVVLATIVLAWGRMEQRLNHIDKVMTPEALQEYGALKARVDAIERGLNQ